MLGERLALGRLHQEEQPCPDGLTFAPQLCGRAPGAATAWAYRWANWKALVPKTGVGARGRRNSVQAEPRRPTRSLTASRRSAPAEDGYEPKDQY